MDVDALLAEELGRFPGQVAGILDGLSEDDLRWRADPLANPVGWLVWHLSRVTDDHVAAVAGTEQVWTAQGWSDRFDLPFQPGDIGFGHDAEQVAQLGRVAGSPGLLTGYHDAVVQAATAYVATLTPAALDRVVDERWDPPVTLGVRLVSVVAEVNQHLGQAAYLKGLLERR